MQHAAHSYADVHQHVLSCLEEGSSQKLEQPQLDWGYLKCFVPRALERRIRYRRWDATNESDAQPQVSDRSMLTGVHCSNGFQTGMLPLQHLLLRQTVAAQSDAVIVMWECTPETMSSTMRKAVRCSTELERRHGSFEVKLLVEEEVAFADQMARHFVNTSDREATDAVGT
eukprot:1490667-Rhodomonas_salina.1